ncbi:MAG: cytochrome c3 family protein [Candidatus Eisenbacteria bacterium]
MSRRGFIAVYGAVLAAMATVSLPDVFAAEPAGVPEEDRCAACHKDLGSDVVDVDLFYGADIHARSGLGCAACHGGDPATDDPDEAMAASAGFLGAPAHGESPEFCGRCHQDPEYMRRFNPRLPVDQLTLYRTSRHGKLWSKGDRSAATCVSCHGVHDIRPASEPKSPIHPRNLSDTCGHCHSDAALMAPYGIPTDQVADYHESVHWEFIRDRGDLSAPTCNDCHGNHGALPPEVKSISGVCGQCHVQNRALFARGPKKAIFDDAGFPECETCHGNHAIRPLTDGAVGLGEGALCAQCHEDDGSPAAEAILRMSRALLDLSDTLAVSEAALHGAIQKGMYLTDAEFLWRDARQKLYESRTILHGFEPEPLVASTGEGLKLARQVNADALGAMKEYRYRRDGLLVATLIVSVLAVLLYLKIRTLE